MTAVTAVKPIYNRKTKTYDVDVRRDANVLLAHEGFLVFQDAAYALAGVQSGSLIGSWEPKKRAAVKVFLTREVYGADSPL